MYPSEGSGDRANLDVVRADELTSVRLERWVAQDKAIALEHQLQALQSEHGLCDGRLRQMADEILYQLERRREAEQVAEKATRELRAIRSTLWWRLGWLPRLFRAHIR